MKRHSLVVFAATALATAGSAHAEALGPVSVFANAAPLQKVLILALLAATLAGAAIAVRKLVAGPRLAGGSAFLSGLRLGAPIAGLLGGAFAAFRISLGVANIGDAATLRLLAPGLAEAAAVVALGLLCGIVAVVLNWAVEARIDREVLR
jgi:hypothetical protein